MNSHHCWERRSDAILTQHWVAEIVQQTTCIHCIQYWINMIGPVSTTWSNFWTQNKDKFMNIADGGPKAKIRIIIATHLKYRLEYFYSLCKSDIYSSIQLILYFKNFWCISSYYMFQNINTTNKVYVLKNVKLLYWSY